MTQGNAPFILERPSDVRFWTWWYFSIVLLCLYQPSPPSESCMAKAAIPLAWITAVESRSRLCADGHHWARRVARICGLAQVGGRYVEAPVLGSAAKAERGALVLMAGCESEEKLEASPALPVLRALGGDAQPVHVGKVRGPSPLLCCVMFVCELSVAASCLPLSRVCSAAITRR